MATGLQQKRRAGLGWSALAQTTFLSSLLDRLDSKRNAARALFGCSCYRANIQAAHQPFSSWILVRDGGRSLFFRPSSMVTDKQPWEQSPHIVPSITLHNFFPPKLFCTLRLVLKKAVKLSSSSKDRSLHSKLGEVTPQGTPHSLLRRLLVKKLALESDKCYSEPAMGANRSPRWGENRVDL